MHVLFPGRHHLLTDFQFKYIYSLIQSGFTDVLDVNGKPLGITEPVSDLIFAVTSANHSNTRRNPLPFYLRAMAIQSFADGLGIDTYIYGIDDVGNLDNFATYTLKKITHESDGKFHLTKDNTIVICSTPVLHMYAQLGFKILPSELLDVKKWSYTTELPWEIVEHVAKCGTTWQRDKKFLEKTNSSSITIWKRYQLGTKIQTLFNDSIIGDDGDITSTRDYNSYVRQMDDIAELKHKETAPFIRSGRIGDIGCAAGSWIKLACKEERFRESDFYGIEVTRFLYDICQQRKHNGDFENPNVFFARKNAITEPVFDRNSMNTIHTSSLTHEIESYGGSSDLLKFIQNRYEELIPGGVWINRDVVGPENGNRLVYLEASKVDGIYDPKPENPIEKTEITSYLSGLCTFSKFLCFANDYRKQEGYTVKFSIENLCGKELIKIKLSDACEFITKKDYTDNWQSEMHETFCYWSFPNWKDQLCATGFRISNDSLVYSNPWIVNNRWISHVSLYDVIDSKLIQIDYPVTNMLMICEKM